MAEHVFIIYEREMQQALILCTIIPLKYLNLLLEIYTVQQLSFFKDIKVTIKNLNCLFMHIIFLFYYFSQNLLSK